MVIKIITIDLILNYKLKIVGKFILLAKMAIYVLVLEVLKWLMKEIKKF